MNKLYPEILRFLLSGAVLELRHVSEYFRGMLGKLMNCEVSL